MKGFALDEKGDVILENGEIKMAEGDELLMQTCRQVIGTNQGEWFLNGSEGVHFDNLLTKAPNELLIRDEIQAGLFQVDDALRIQEFTCDLAEGRKLEVQFTAQNDSGQTVKGGKREARGNKRRVDRFSSCFCYRAD